MRPRPAWLESSCKPMTHFGVEAPALLFGGFSQLFAEFLGNPEQGTIGLARQDDGLCHGFRRSQEIDITRSRRVIRSRDTAISPHKKGRLPGGPSRYGSTQWSWE